MLVWSRLDPMIKRKGQATPISSMAHEYYITPQVVESRTGSVVAIKDFL